MLSNQATPIRHTDLNKIKYYVHAIENLDLSDIKRKLVSQYVGSNLTCYESKIELSSVEYKNCLYLVKKYKDLGVKFIPTKEIDEIWHQHILFTKKYFKDCMDIFEHYLHHSPFTVGYDRCQANKDFQIFSAIYELEFDQPMYKFIESQSESKCTNISLKNPFYSEAKMIFKKKSHLNIKMENYTVKPNIKIHIPYAEIGGECGDSCFSVSDCDHNCIDV